MVILMLSYVTIDLKRTKHRPHVSAAQEEEEFEDDGDVHMNKLHQALLMAFDSPLRKAGLLEIYVYTDTKRLIEFRSDYRLPRTIRVFRKVMTSLYSDAAGRVEDKDGKILIRIMAVEALGRLSATWKKRLAIHPRALALVHGDHLDGIVRNNVETKRDETLVIEVAYSEDVNHVLFTEHVMRLTDFPVTPATSISRILFSLERVLNLECPQYPMNGAEVVVDGGQMTSANGNTTE